MNRPFRSLSRRAPGVLLPSALILAGCAIDPTAPSVDSVDPLVSGDSTPEAPDVVDEASADGQPDGQSRRSRDTAFGGNSTGVSDCARESYHHYEDPSAGATQLHVVGIYESPSGEVDVRVSRPGSTVLVLSSYEAVHWNVSAARRASIERVILTSFDPSSATVPDGVPVEVHSFVGEDALPGLAAYMWPSVDAADLVDAAEDETRRRLTSFRSCYDATRFDIDRPGRIRPPHRVTRKTEPTLLPGCEALAAESNYCMVKTGGQLVNLGLDSGTICEGGVDAGPYGVSGSLGWHGDYVYSCDWEIGIVRASVVDGSVDVAPLSCTSVTTDDDGSLIGMLGSPGTSDALTRFTFKQAAAREVGRPFDVVPFATRVAVNNGRGFYAWHSTGVVETSALEDGAPIESIALEGFDDWIQGIDATDDGTLVIAGGIMGERTLLFDAATGEARGAMESGLQLVNGLACEAGGR